MNKQLLVQHPTAELLVHSKITSKKGPRGALSVVCSTEASSYLTENAGKVIIIIGFYTRENNISHVFCCCSSIVPFLQPLQWEGREKGQRWEKKSTVFLWPLLAYTRCMAASAFSSPTFPTLLPKSCSPFGEHCHLLVHLSILFQSPTKWSWSLHQISPQQHNQLKQISLSNNSEVFILRKIKHISLTEEGACHYGSGKKIPLHFKYAQPLQW